MALTRYTENFLKVFLSSEQDSVAGPSVGSIHLFRCISNIILFSRTSLNRKWTRIIGCYDNLGVRRFQPVMNNLLTFLKVIPLKLFYYQTFLKLGIVNIHDMNIEKMQ